MACVLRQDHTTLPSPAVRAPCRGLHKYDMLLLWLLPQALPLASPASAEATSASALLLPLRLLSDRAAVSIRGVLRADARASIVSHGSAGSATCVCTCAQGRTDKRSSGG